MFVGRGGSSPSLVSVVDLIRLAPRGGSGLVKSGPVMDFFLPLGGDPLFDLSFPKGVLDASEGLRNLAPDSDGLLDAGSWP